MFETTKQQLTSSPSDASAGGQIGTGFQWFGLRENLQETTIFNGNNHGFRLRFSPTSQTIE